MKALLTIALLTVSCSSFAWTSKGAPTKEFTFKYKLSGQVFEVKRSAASYEEAFEVAADTCFKHFKGEGQVSEDRGLDIIDVCANPRS